MAGVWGSWACGLIAVGLAATAGVAAVPNAATAQTTPGANTHTGAGVCPPAAVALSFSDALDKLTRNGVELGGLSSLAFDRRSGAWVSTVDNHGSDPARIWVFRDLTSPTVVRDPLVLKRPDGTPYDGATADNEGLAVLPDGDFVVSSETEPSIRIFGRDGLQRASLPVPARFAVSGTTPEGQATSNATLEGLTITPSGRRIVAAMEGALSGDISATGDATLHRFLVYDAGAHGQWRLTKQVAYRTEAGQRVPEVAAYGENSLLVEEASFSTTTGNAVSLFAVTGLDRAPDVSAVPNLSLAPAGDILDKRLVADLVRCPTLGATSKEAQANPLLDNYEGMAITWAHRIGLGKGPVLAGVSLISDDNFSATQITRILNLAARLPR
jgi:hypothetical protein